MLVTLLSFVAVIVLVVSVHEYGHYLAARLLKVPVVRFSIGFGKPLLIWRDDRGTEWALSPILLGGYVRLLDRDNLHLYKAEPRHTVEARPPWQRIVIYAAGPLANFVLSLGISLLLLAGGQQGLRPLVDEVRAHSPAAAAGLAAGDELARINDADIALWQQAEIALVDGILADAPITVHTQSGGAHILAGEHIEALEQHGGGARALGLFPYTRHIKLTLARVLPDSPGARAGLQSGDVLVMMDDTVLERWHDAVAVIEKNAGRPIAAVIWRDGGAHTLTVTPAQVRQGGRQRGYLGVAPVLDAAELQKMLVTLEYSAPQWLAAALRQTGGDIARAVAFLQLVFSARISNEQISGPIGIAVHSGEAAALGLEVWLRFVTLISTSLGIINLLPLPLLDGGQIVLNVIEWARRRELTASAMRLWHICGALILLSLMGFVIINDILQLF